MLLGNTFLGFIKKYTIKTTPHSMAIIFCSLIIPVKTTIFTGILKMPKEEGGDY